MFASRSVFRPFHGIGIDVFLIWSSAVLHRGAVCPAAHLGRGARLYAAARSAWLCIGVGLLCLMLGAVAQSSPASARVPQSPVAAVTGTVTDQTGAVVVNAEVLILNLASGRRSMTKTDSA